jgi:hypothetical protein
MLTSPSPRKNQSSLGESGEIGKRTGLRIRKLTLLDFVGIRYFQNDLKWLEQKQTPTKTQETRG